MFKLANYSSIIVICLGTGLEYYDFIIYSFMSYYLTQLFFPESPSSIAIFISFSISYILRPLSGLIFGILGDRFGRKPVFFATMMLSTISALAISVLPTYQFIGINATFLLILFRIIQSLAFGAELPGAATFINEVYRSNNKGGFYSGILMIPIAVGDLLASSTLFILTHYINKQDMLTWGWRIPFFLGGIFAMISFFLRNQLIETPEFINYLYNTKKKPATSFLKSIKWKKILIGICISLPGPFLVLLTLNIIPHLVNYFHYNLSVLYLASSFGVVIAAILSPIVGFTADRIGYAKSAIIQMISIAIISSISFTLLDQGNLVYPVCLLIICQVGSYTIYTSIITMLGSLFQVNIRYTSTAISYNLSCCIASLIPVFCTTIIEYTKNPMWMCFTLLFIFTISITIYLISVPVTKVKKDIIRISNKNYS